MTARARCDLRRVSDDEHLNTAPQPLPDGLFVYQGLLDKLVEKDRDARFRNADEVLGFLLRKFGAAEKSADVTQKLR